MPYLSFNNFSNHPSSEFHDELFYQKNLARNHLFEVLQIEAARQLEKYLRKWDNDKLI
jgi:hypothetical protein